VGFFTFAAVSWFIRGFLFADTSSYAALYNVGYRQKLQLTQAAFYGDHKKLNCNSSNCFFVFI
jgi:hypothetical protein